MSLCLWIIKLIFRKATYYISGSADRRVTNGGAIFRLSYAITSSDYRRETIFKMTFTADSTTAEFACCSRGVTRSMMDSASFESVASYSAKVSRRKTWPHSVHSLRAASILYRVLEVSAMTSMPEDS